MQEATPLAANLSDPDSPPMKLVRAGLKNSEVETPLMLERGFTTVTSARGSLVHDAIHSDLFGVDQSNNVDETGVSLSI